MALAHFRMLIHELLNKDPDIVPEEEPIIILDIKSDLCMNYNGNDTNNTRHIARRVHFVRKSDKFKLHHIYWCEGGLNFAYIATKNVGENYLNPGMKYIMVSFDN